METIEYKAHNRADWPKGKWDNEPDKIQWQDPTTKLPCLMVRNSMGAGAVMLECLEIIQHMK